MDFRIADTFTQSLAKLRGDEQKAAKTAAFDLQVNPSNPGLQFHKLDRARDKSFWSVRVSRDIRIIVHRTSRSLLLCYVDHHDEAYEWAARRKIETHPNTGAAQIVEIRELIREVEIPRYVEAAAPRNAATALALEGVTEDNLLSYGVPREWVADLLAADEDRLLSLTDHLPAEAAEAVLNLATGTTPAVPAVVGEDADPFNHPDAQRRFRVMTDVEELRLALEYPWERWTVFLHPMQRSIVERVFGGPSRVAGSAGTGKTVVAMHRAVNLARKHSGARVLLTTFSIPLARMLRIKVDRLVGDDRPLRGRVRVRSIDEVGLELYESQFGKPAVPTEVMLRSILEDAVRERGDDKMSLGFLEAEWREVVDAWQLESWEAYRDVPRLGRKTRLSEKQRETMWRVFARVRDALESRGLVTMPMVFRAITERLRAGDAAPAEYVVVDEAQDIGVDHLRFLAALAGNKEDGLFFAGDLGQRIFRTPFSWVSLGVDVRGRSQTLRMNYRTSHQIRRQADRLLHPEIADVDGNIETRKGTISAFNGPEPKIIVSGSGDEECDALANWMRSRISEGVSSAEIAIFVRSEAELPRAHAAVREAGLRAELLTDDAEPRENAVSVCTMHRAKGMEFRAVAVMACDDEIVPLQSRIERVTDDADLAEVYNTERHLLYVACTRARDHLLISGVEPASEFLDDLSCR